MSERFRRLYQLPLNLYSIGSPIILSAAALQKDNQTGKVIVQLKFQSVTNKIIKAIKVSISAFDIENIELQGIVNYQYLDLHIHHGQYFGSDKAIILPDHVTRSFNVNSVKVYFDDNTETIVNVPLYPLPDKVPFSTVTSNYQLQKQYTLAINDKANYIPQERFNLWQCSCGEWNGTTRCSCCMIARDCVFTAYDISSLTDKMEQRLALEKAEAEAAAERKRIEEEKQRIEAEQQEKLRQERMQKYTKLIRKISIPVVCILFVTMVFTQWLYPNIVIPALAYMKANQLLNNGQYEEAKSAFNALGEYKDSPEKVEDIIELMSVLKYNKAIDLAQNGSYADAIEIFEELGDYEASIEWLDYARLEKLKADGNPYIDISSDLFDARFKEYLVYLDIPYAESGFTKDSTTNNSDDYDLGYANFLNEECFVRLDYNQDTSLSPCLLIGTDLFNGTHIKFAELKANLIKIGCRIIAKDENSFKTQIPNSELEIEAHYYGDDIGLLYIKKKDTTSKSDATTSNTTAPTTKIQESSDSSTKAQESSDSEKKEPSSSGGSSGSGAFYVGGQKVTQPSQVKTTTSAQTTSNRPSIEEIGNLLSEKLKFQVEVESVDDGEYLYTITVKNKSEYTLKYFNFHFDIKNKSDKTLDSVYLESSKALKAGATKHFKCYSDYQCVNYTIRSDYGVDYDIQW